MAEERTTGSGQNTSPPARRPGLLRFLLWELPWHIVGILLAGAGKSARAQDDGNRTGLSVLTFYPQPVSV